MPSKRKRRVQTRKDNYQFLINAQAIETGPSRKKWSRHDLRNVKPLTPAQEQTFDTYFSSEEDKNLCLYGCAGTGKTFLSLYLGFHAVLATNTQKKIMIIRSAVPSREIGFFPGDRNEKIAPYERPYTDVCFELFGRSSTYEDMKKAGLIEFMDTSVLRGVTWDDSFIVLDEGQNMNFDEINTVMTRVGLRSRILFLGDIKQTDLGKSSRDRSGMEDFLKIAYNMEEFEFIQFTTKDIVRSGFVKSWIIASESFNTL